MKAILIDPLAPTPFTEVELEQGLRPLYTALSNPEIGLEVSVVEVAKDDELGNTYWVDEEGLLKDATGFVMLKEHHQPLAGRMVVTGGEQPSGDSGDIDLDPDSLKWNLAVVALQPFFMARMWDGDQWCSLSPGNLELPMPCTGGQALQAVQDYLDSMPAGPVRPARLPEPDDIG